jgi:hypothetical protein
MRRQFSHPPRKRQIRPLTGRKAVQRHAAWQARKADAWTPWVEREAVSIIAAKAKAEADHDAEPERTSSPRRWERRL